MLSNPNKPDSPSSDLSSQIFTTKISVGLMGYTLAGVMILLLFLSFSTEYLQGNFLQAKDFLLSPHFPFLALTAIMLCWKGTSWPRYNLLVLLLTSIYLALFFGKFISLFHMSGDNICQVAYWKVLWHPNLQGRIGVSFTKPGQVFYLGILDQLSSLSGRFLGAYLFKAGIIFAMAVCVWSLVRIAADLGGRVAGLLAFLLTTWAFLNDFLLSESTIYFIATLFGGLRLYYYHPKRRNLGRLLLVASIQFRIEAIAILAVIWLYHLIRKDWRELRLFTIYSLLSLAFFLLVILQIQGSLARLNSGEAVGYVSPVSDSASVGLSRLSYIFQTMTEEFTQSPEVRFLSILAIVGMAGAFAFSGQAYLVVFSSMIVIVINVLFFGGTFNLDRYVSFIYAFACSVGSASVVLFLSAIPRARWRPLLWGLGGAFVLGMLLIFDYSTLNLHADLDPTTETGFLRSSLHIYNNENIPAGSGLLSEDDLLSHLVVLNPTRYRSINSLQLFNVSSEPVRKKILADTDYVWVELEVYYFYYLFYLDNPDWRSDPFRLMVQEILTTGKKKSLYGYSFVPVSVDGVGLLLKVTNQES